MNWADLVMGTVALVGTYKGFRAGFINELMGIVALGGSLWAGFSYGGFWDQAIAGTTHLGAGSSHALGVILFSAELYALISAAGFLLNRIASLPIVNVGNKFLGAFVGLSKTAIFLWAILYVALFFPLTDDLRRDLHQSLLASAATQPDGQIDDALRGTLPDFAKPFAEPYFERHHV
jgi:uncharacterized membrane protein required for colicin V production